MRMKFLQDTCNSMNTIRGWIFNDFRWRSMKIEAKKSFRSREPKNSKGGIDEKGDEHMIDSLNVAAVHQRGRVVDRVA